MRRFLSILLLIIVPLQFAWSATENLHGHLSNEEPVSGFHFHDNGHDHHDANTVDYDGHAASDTPDGHNNDGHHEGHCHHVFTMLIIDPDLKLNKAPSNGRLIRPPASFTSHIPLLFDWPPSAFL